MRVIRNSSGVNNSNKHIISFENDNIYINSRISMLSMEKYHGDTKNNIFPDKYIYKHTWLTNGYKSTYKKDFMI
tara:strand:- start:933 stop:1154 length:222 start_codon:yes stop_codon:yes gene_type:complete